MSQLNDIAAPILKQQGLQLAHLECTFDIETSSTVYTVASACGKIGSFSIPATIFCDVHRQDKIAELLAAHFRTMEFSDGQSFVSEVQPELPSTASDAGQPEQDPEAINSDNATVESPVDAGGPQAPAKPARKKQRPGQTIEPTGEHSTEERSAVIPASPEAGGESPEPASASE